MITFYVRRGLDKKDCDHFHATLEEAQRCIDNFRIENPEIRYEDFAIIAITEQVIKLDFGDPYKAEEEKYEKISERFRTDPCWKEFQSALLKLPAFQSEVSVAARNLSARSHINLELPCIVCGKKEKMDPRKLYCSSKCETKAAGWSPDKKAKAMEARKELIKKSATTQKEKSASASTMGMKSRKLVEITCRICGKKDLRAPSAKICTSLECKHKADNQRQQKCRRGNAE